MYENFTEEMMDWLEQSHSSYHVIEIIKRECCKKGFVELKESETWALVPGGAYFVTRNHSSLLAFRIPKQEGAWADCALHLMASHSDSPTFKIKPQAEMSAEGGLVRLNIEKYGGMICASWFDRPLSIAGRALISDVGSCSIRERLFAAEEDLLMIPSLAIHMNREVNEHASYNVQKDMPVLFAGDGDLQGFEAYLRSLLQLKEGEQLLGRDVFLVNRTKPCLWGKKKEFLSSPRLDDLECAYSSLRGFLDAEEQAGVLPFYCVFDNEETGSLSRQGAQSTFLPDTLARLRRTLDWSEEDYQRILAKSFLVSADNAHAVHPNASEKADPSNRPQMNGGIVIKYHANQKYTTDGRSEAIFRSICQREQIPVQTFANRSDMQGGSTLGNLLNSQRSLLAVDIGLAQLAMHSSYETGGSQDPAYLARFARRYFSHALPFLLEESEVTP